MINRQYNFEIGNFGGYQNISNIAANQAWDGFASFFQEYALDEITHAQKIADFIVSRNRTPYVDALPRPNIGNPQTPVDWVNVAYGKAQDYTALIKQVYEQCLKENDYEASIFEQWYLVEQRRVEQVWYDLGQELGRAGSNAGLLLIDARFKKE